MNDRITIYREENGYANISGLGIRESGKLVIVKEGEDFPEFDKNTRFIKNAPVPGAFTAPIKAFLDATLKCQLSCPFCLAAVPEIRSLGKKKYELTETELLRVVEQIINAGVMKVKIGGGEPFSYKYFCTLLTALREAGIFISTSTSGITLDKIKSEQLQILRETGTKVSLSLDGCSSFHDDMRKSPGLHNKVLAGLDLLRRNGISVELRATIFNTRESVRQILYLNEISVEKDIRMRVRPARPKGSAARNQIAFLSPNKEWADFFHNARRLRLGNPKFDITEELDFDGSPDYATWDKGMDCAAGTRTAFVNHEGQFMPCGFIESNFLGESITDERDILSIWQSGTSFINVRQYFRTLSTVSECGKCAHVNECQGGCPSVRFSANKDKTPLCPLDLAKETEY